MVKSGQAAVPPIVPLVWRSARPGAHVEVLHLEDVAPRVARDCVERMEFHLFALYLGGQCRHTVDFAEYDCARGTVVHVRPGQVQRWQLSHGVRGAVLFFKPSFLPASLRRALVGPSDRFFEEIDWPTTFSVAEENLAAAEAWFTLLKKTAGAADNSPVCETILRHLVSAAVLDIVRHRLLTPKTSPLTEDERTRARQFQAHVERSFRVTRSVLEYAERLRCSPRTLDRTCRLAFGVSAKAYLDGRVVLEARRLLSHTRDSIAVIGEELGFSEATNFVKFFKGRTGELPGAFRTEQARGAAD